jgi:hypothetical protein
MTQWQWKVGLAAGTALVIAAGAGRLAAQSARSAGRAGIVRNPALAQAPQARGTRITAQAAQTGLVLVLDYDPDLAKNLDLDDNGTDTDNGDRAIRQGDIWLSNRNGDRIRRIGRFVTEFQYWDASGESTATDVTQVTDLQFDRDGQVRASGFWNVDDGAGSPALHVDGTTGTNSLRRYNNGQFFFLDTLSTDEELWFLAR